MKRAASEASNTASHAARQPHQVVGVEKLLTLPFLKNRMWFVMGVRPKLAFVRGFDSVINA